MTEPAKRRRERKSHEDEQVQRRKLLATIQEIRGAFDTIAMRLTAIDARLERLEHIERRRRTGAKTKRLSTPANTSDAGGPSL